MTTMLDIKDNKVSGRHPSTVGRELAVEDVPEHSYHKVQPEKKRRLSADQVQHLEKNFELENKLEPERKAQLAVEIGLEPRQVAIWFQNRRARSKTKQLERDYDSLKVCYDGLMADCDLLKKEKEKLNSQVIQLTNQLKLRRQEALRAKSEPATPINCTNTVAEAQEPAAGGTAKSFWEDASKAITAVSCKQEDVSSARSVVFDSDSPPLRTGYYDGHHTHTRQYFSDLLEEPAISSSLAVETERGMSAGFLQDEDQDRLTKHLSLPPLPPSSCDYDLPSVTNNSCNFAILNSVDDQHSLWSWLY